ncbi:MAG: hypothetical protein AAGJ10_01520 [Bacteroidota bacterium]
MRLTRSTQLLTVLALLIVAGCSSTAEVTAPEPEPTVEPVVEAPVGPAFMRLYFDGSGLYREEADDKRPLMLGVRPGGVEAVAPDGQHVAFAYVAQDSARLAWVDVRNGAIRNLYAAPHNTVYTMDWANDSRALAFGWYVPDAEGNMTDGNVLIAQVGGSIADVGCSASKMVAAWPQPDRLVVGDDRNFYGVDTEGCATRSTQARRKLHHVTFSGDGQHMAYIFRDLAYDRPNRQYVPDSSAFVARFDGSDAERIYSNDYLVRNFQWSPDGDDLLFDVKSQQEEGRRHIALLNIESDRIGYVIPPDATTGSTTHAQWSPSGTNIAYDWTMGGERLKAVRVFRNTKTLGPSYGPTWGWIDDTTLVIPTADGGWQALDVDSDETRFTLPSGARLLYAMPTN